MVENDVARRLRVDAIMPETLTGSSWIQVESPELADGLQIVVEGVHFLSDGDRVRPVDPGDSPSTVEG